MFQGLRFSHWQPDSRPDGIVVLTLDRSDQGVNALSREVLDELDALTERSVTRAAERLNRTQSAVSHALARLREQVGDPLLVRMGGRMTASPFAERLIDDVRPILRSIQRVLLPAQPFDAATSTRTFRIAVSDIAPSLFPRLMAEASRLAPHITIDWVTETPQTALAVADGQIDVAFVASALS